ncbi:hypothetical protein KGF54_004866 [Candida jiufengensis]|uniref:uncharacterized protein n=1 Tax=Candida jiufengensis TaxID=497108 RepID=UPI0022244B47|nr:uncharacterized protein KGF54_004866 [Candida jiufengensis]KAI5951791.1 hypothetical protein KGF54_004866 [Candida jiufengensis]
MFKLDGPAKPGAKVGIISTKNIGSASDLSTLRKFLVGDVVAFTEARVTNGKNESLSTLKKLSNLDIAGDNRALLIINDSTNVKPIIDFNIYESKILKSRHGPIDSFLQKTGSDKVAANTNQKPIGNTFTEPQQLLEIPPQLSEVSQQLLEPQAKEVNPQQQLSNIKSRTPLRSINVNTKGNRVTKRNVKKVQKGPLDYYFQNVNSKNQLKNFNSNISVKTPQQQPSNLEHQQQQLNLEHQQQQINLEHQQQQINLEHQQQQINLVHQQQPLNLEPQQQQLNLEHQQQLSSYSEHQQQPSLYAAPLEQPKISLGVIDSSLVLSSAYPTVPLISNDPTVNSASTLPILKLRPKRIWRKEELLEEFSKKYPNAITDEDSLNAALSKLSPDGKIEFPATHPNVELPVPNKSLKFDASVIEFLSSDEAYEKGYNMIDVTRFISRVSVQLLKIYETHILFIVVYAPNKDKYNRQSQEFFSDLKKYLSFFNFEKILLGDLNIVQDPNHSQLFNYAITNNESESITTVKRIHEENNLCNTIKSICSEALVFSNHHKLNCRLIDALDISTERLSGLIDLEINFKIKNSTHGIITAQINFGEYEVRDELQKIKTLNEDKVSKLIIPYSNNCACEHFFGREIGSISDEIRGSGLPIAEEIPQNILNMESVPYRFDLCKRSNQYYAIYKVGILNGIATLDILPNVDYDEFMEIIKIVESNEFKALTITTINAGYNSGKAECLKLSPK